MIFVKPALDSIHFQFLSAVRLETVKHVCFMVVTVTS